MSTLHIGRGKTRGGMTVFPVWSDTRGFGRYTTTSKHLDVTEVESGPDVGTLMVGNVGDRPGLVFEGQLFEGGLQHRMATRSVMVGVHQRIPVEVACVEQGRWSGARRQRTLGRRATPYVRDAVRRGADVQGEVWRRVARHTEGTDNPTSSFVHRLDQDGAHQWSDYRPLAGQVGVLVGVGGQPYVVEVFDSPYVLRRQLPALLQAAALDALHAPAVATPGRRARRFVDRLALVRPQSTRPAGVAEEVSGRTQYADLAALRWDGRQVHARATNVRHPLLVGA